MTQNYFTDNNGIFESKLVSVIGLGGAGGNIVEDLHLLDSESLGVYRFDTGVSAGEISPLFGRMTIIAVGLGGHYGTTTLLELIKNNRNNNSCVFVVATLPYHFEGEAKRRKALDVIEAIKGQGCTVVAFENDRISEMHSEEGLMFMNRPICESVKGLIGLLLEPCMISLDYNDINAFSKEVGMGCMAFIPLINEIKPEVVEKSLSLCVADNEPKKMIMGIFSDGTIDNKELIAKLKEYMTSQSQDMDLIWGLYKVPEGGFTGIFIFQG